ncbi:hypothetical protein [Mycobacterium saskatchewanense]|uniref:hypothetical protein n=1 Tax=Mycobacterium saskatchewanense TaxID=220927 RepID=UPI00115262C3|nr:hypothetical protein [Mycobacterium saskatchewanense]
MATVLICCACGYPTVGLELCFYCRPIAGQALNGGQQFDGVYPPTSSRQKSEVWGSAPNPIARAS